MSKILTITLNPAVDLSTSVERVVAGPKLRCATPKVDAGGGGINISRAIQILGGSSTAFVATAGRTGATLLCLLEELGVTVLPFDGPGETRQSIMVTDDSTEAQYRFVLPGPVWAKEETARALTEIKEVAPKHRFIVLSGSMPPGTPDDIVSTLADIANNAGAKLLVDTSGAALKQIVSAPKHKPYLVRLNQREAEDVSGRSLVNERDCIAFAADRVAAGVANVIIVGRGRDGSVLVSKGECLTCTAAEVPIKSRTGAGDSFLAALTLSLSRGEPHAIALQWGVAAASSALTTDATALCTKASTERLRAECDIAHI